MVVMPDPILCADGPHTHPWPWTVAGVLVSVGIALLFSWRLKKIVAQKTSELRSELFERQMAEKELKASQQKLMRSLDEKNALLKEIHHRVKNNLQVVSSLLYLQGETIKDEKGLELLKESQNRIKSMALVHEQLYSTKDLSEIDFGRYVHGLASNLFDAYGIDPALIRLKVNADELSLGVDMAVPCGLIINELVSNALKHAFPSDRKGTLQIDVAHSLKNELLLAIEDNGVGMPVQTDPEQTASLGLRLVNTLVSQLEGELIMRSDAGTRFQITLKMHDTLERSN